MRILAFYLKVSYHYAFLDTSDPSQVHLRDRKSEISVRSQNWISISFYHITDMVIYGLPFAWSLLCTLLYTYGQSYTNGKSNYKISSCTLLPEKRLPPPRPWVLFLDFFSPRFFERPTTRRLWIILERLLISISLT